MKVIVKNHISKKYKHSKYKHFLEFNLYFDYNINKNIKSKYKILSSFLNINLCNILNVELQKYNYEFKHSYINICLNDDTEYNEISLNTNLNDGFISNDYYDIIDKIDISKLLYIEFYIYIIYDKNEIIKTNITNFINNELKNNLEELLKSFNKFENSGNLLTSSESSEEFDKNLSISDLTLSDSSDSI